MLETPSSAMIAVALPYRSYGEILYGRLDINSTSDSYVRHDVSRIKGDRDHYPCNNWMARDIVVSGVA